MVSLNDLQNAYDEAKKESAGGGSKFYTVGKTTVQFAYAVFTSPPVYFPHKAMDKTDKDRAKDEAWDVANGNGLKPTSGVLTTIKGDNLPLSKEGKLDFDIQAFVSLWPNQNDVSLDDEQRKLMGSHKFPIEAVMDALMALGDNNPVDNEKWCLVAQVPDGWRKARGDKQTKIVNGEEKQYDWRIHIVEKVFANEAEAKAEAEKIKAGLSTNNNGKLSAKAIGDGWSEESLKGQAKEIDQAVANVVKNTNATQADAIGQVAAMYGIETSDIELALTFTNPL